MNTQWINSDGATLNGFIPHGRLWVVDELPITGKGAIEIWQAQASQGDTMYRLFGKWAEGHIYELPRPAYGREEKFMEYMQGTPGQMALVVHDAHLVRANVLDKMRLLADAGVLVVLVGDVSKISVLTDNFPGFSQRAMYCVAVANLFDVAVKKGKAA